MLTAAFPKLENLKSTQLLRAFFRSGWYIALVAALMAVSELFALELPVYYIYLALGTLCMLFADDTLGLIPLICCAYMTFARQNNPVHFPDTGRFSHPSAQLQLGAIVAVAAILLIGRLIVCLIVQPKRGGLPRLAVGFFVLLVGFTLFGVGQSGFTLQSAFIGFLVAFALCALYFYFYFTIDWKTVKKSWLFLFVLIMGAGILIQIVGMYFAPGIFENGKINRYRLYTGWGTYNNVGCMMCMCMPAPFYFAVKRRHGWLYSAVGYLYFAGLLLTQSRGSILFGAVIFLGCIIVTLVKTKGKARWGHVAVLGAAVLLAGCAVAIFWDKFVVLFNSMVKTIFKGDFDGVSTGRVTLWIRSWEGFLAHPVIGMGWTEIHRAHNTVLQLLSSGGVIGLVLYLAHRVNTLWLLFRRPTLEKTVIGLIIAGVVLTSLVDVHIFAFGPGLLYGVAFVFAERAAGKEDAPAPQNQKEN